MRQTLLKNNRNFHRYNDDFDRDFAKFDRNFKIMWRLAICFIVCVFIAIVSFYAFSGYLLYTVGPDGLANRVGQVVGSGLNGYEQSRNR